MYMAGGPRPRETKPFSTNVLTTDSHRYRRNSLLYETYPRAGARRPDRRLGARRLHRRRRPCRTRTSSPGCRSRCCSSRPARDAVVSTPAIERYVRQIKSASLLTIDGARHEIWQEADIYREQLLAAFDAFVPGSDPAIA